MSKELKHNKNTRSNSKMTTSSSNNDKSNNAKSNTSKSKNNIKNNKNEKNKKQNNNSDDDGDDFYDDSDYETEDSSHYETEDDDSSSNDDDYDSDEDDDEEEEYDSDKEHDHDIEDSKNNNKYNNKSTTSSKKKDKKKDDTVNSLEYKKLLQSIFPSKYIDEKVKNAENKEKVSSKKSENNNKTKGKKNKEEKEPVSEKINILLTVCENDDEYYEDDSEWEDDTNDSSTENEDDDVSTDTDTEDEKEDDKEDEKYNKKNIVKEKNKKENNNDIIETNKYTKTNIDIIADEKINILDEDMNGIIDILNSIKNKENINEKNKYLINECIDVCKSKLSILKRKNEKKMKKEQERNLRIFRKIIKDKNTLNDYSYFKTLDTENQKKIIKEMRKINEVSRIEKPYRILLLESDLPTEFKNQAMKKISLLKYMDPGSGEYYKIKNWVDTFMHIPFGKYQNLDINIESGIETCHEFMENAKNTLDQAVYGMGDAKLQILQLLGQLITNPSAIGTSVAIHGVPGSGKTTLLKEGVSKILNRPFAFIALGGATDSSFLEGHGYTYEGSSWGKIVQILINSRCMNPVIYFDELDKISETPKGDEILNILVHLTDTTQNSEFHDKYFSEIKFDLSRCLFIFSYNDESKISPILLDRMYKIKTDGYSNKEKLVISNDYLLPKIREQIKFNIGDIIIENEVLQYIIERYTSNEKGVRNIKRCLEIIYSKINLFRLMKPDNNLFDTEIKIKVEFPCIVTKTMIDNLLKINNLNETYKSMYI